VTRRWFDRPGRRRTRAAQRHQRLVTGSRSRDAGGNVDAAVESVVHAMRRAALEEPGTRPGILFGRARGGHAQDGIDHQVGCAAGEHAPGWCARRRRRPGNRVVKPPERDAGPDPVSRPAPRRVRARRVRRSTAGRWEHAGGSPLRPARVTAPSRPGSRRSTAPAGSGRGPWRPPIHLRRAWPPRRSRMGVRWRGGRCSSR